ncbi:MAG: hypothetical protein V2I35_13785 [Desulfocapsaceae bacterium]|jgi:hypothetical protein|nr:hypothetical protein [Desulfocapsaceae bacterium]
MNFHNQIHFTAQQTTGFEIRQQLRRRRVTDLPGGKMLWLAVAKVSCLVLVAVCCSALWTGSLSNRAGASIKAVEADLHAIRNEQITLLAERAQLMSAKNIHSQAQEALALYVPEEGQVYKIR